MRAILTLIVFICLLPVASFIGLTFILGHGRVFPYFSTWIDRIAFLLRFA